MSRGAKGIRTPGPTVNGADTEGRPTPTIAPSPESAAYRSGISLRQHVGPGVRIHFAPAASQLRTCLRQKEPGSHRTLRWRKRNSNLLSPVRKILCKHQDAPPERVASLAGTTDAANGKPDFRGTQSRGSRRLSTRSS